MGAWVFAPSLLGTVDGPEIYGPSPAQIQYLDDHHDRVVAEFAHARGLSPERCPRHGHRRGWEVDRTAMGLAELKKVLPQIEAHIIALDEVRQCIAGDSGCAPYPGPPATPEGRIDELFPDILAKCGETSYALDFGADDPEERATLFRQVTDEDGPSRGTGLLLVPDDADLADQKERETVEANMLGRADREHLQLVGELIALGRSWQQENEALAVGEVFARRVVREAELRAIFDRWCVGRGSRVVAH